MLIQLLPFQEAMIQILEALYPEQSEEEADADFKYQAEMLLSDPRRKVLIPTQEEWLGFNLLERDGEIRRQKGSAK